MSNRAVRKKAILIDKTEEEYFGLSEEDALVKDLESHFEKIGNLKIEIQSREQQKTLVAEAEYGVDFASGCEYQDSSSGITGGKHNRHFTGNPQSNSTEKHRLSELRKAKKQQKSNQAKTEEDSSGKLSVNDCSKFAKVLEEGDKTRAEVLTEDNSKNILESVSVEQVTDKSVVRSSV